MFYDDFDDKESLILEDPTGGAVSRSAVEC